MVFAKVKLPVLFSHEASLGEIIIRQLRNAGIVHSKVEKKAFKVTTVLGSLAWKYTTNCWPIFFDSFLECCI